MLQFASNTEASSNNFYKSLSTRLQMKLSSIFAILFALTLVACGGPSAPESASSEGYGTTHEGKPAEGRNALEE
ncbi:MAG: hypothetical protein MRJ52_01715 [Nitrosomonas sp.]|jgi:hypothetical protein|nr:hypothetical protein [Nitrosomonas sp.]